MLQHHKGKVPHSIKQLTPCVLDAELDCFEDFELKKKIFWANKDRPFLVIQVKKKKK